MEETGLRFFHPSHPPKGVALETTMTATSVITSGVTVLQNFALYLGIAVAVPLGFALVPRIKRWVTKR